MLQQTSCLTGHNKPIQETRWLFPGALTSTAHEMLLTSSLDRTVRMWDLRSKKVSLCLDFHADLRTIERDGQICAPVLPIQILGCNRCYLPVAVGSDICFSDIRMCRSLRVPILPYTQLETSEYHFQEPSTPLADEGNIAFFSEHIIAFESGAMVFSHESMGRESTRMEVIEIDTSEHQPVMCIGNGGSSWCIFGTADEVVHFEQLASHTTGASDAYPSRFFYRTRDDWNTQKKREMVNPAFPLSIATLNVTGTNELNTFIGTGDGYIHIIQHHTEDYVSQDYNCTHTDPSLAVEIDAELTLLAHEGSACISVGVDDRKTRMLTASHGGQVTVWNLGSLMQCENAGDDECAEELVTLNVFETRSRGLLNDLDTLFTGITMLQVALCTNIPVDDSQSEQYPLMVYQGY